MRSALLAALLLPLAAFGQSSVGLEWKHDGVDVAGFRLYAGPTPVYYEMANSITLPDASLRSARFGGLSDGVWYFAATAYSPAGVESGPSNIVCAALGPFSCRPPAAPGSLAVASDVPPPAGLSIVRFTVTQRRDSTAVAGTMIQMADLQLMQGENVIAWPPGTVATNPGGSNPANEQAPNLLDADAATKALDFNFTTSETSLAGSSVFVFQGTLPDFDGYRWRTGNDAPERDPVSWTLELSDDGVTFRTLDNRIDADVPAERGAFTPTFRF